MAGGPRSCHPPAPPRYPRLSMPPLPRWAGPATLGPAGASGHVAPTVQILLTSAESQPPMHTVHLEHLPQTSLQGHRLTERSSPSRSVCARTAVRPSHGARPGAQHDHSVTTHWLSVHCVLVTDQVMAHSSEPDNSQLAGGSAPMGKPGRGGRRKARRSRKREKGLPKCDL